MTTANFQAEAVKEEATDETKRQLSAGVLVLFVVMGVAMGLLAVVLAG